MPEKVDYRKEWKHLYGPSAKEVRRVVVPPHNYLMIDGAGDPNRSAEYAAAIEALFSVSYTLKFAVKKGAQALDYSVMPLEGLWWAEDMSSFATGDKSAWQWTMMILQPQVITAPTVVAAIDDVAKKKNLSALSKLRFETFEEGVCAQILHIGPFSDEGPTIEKLHAWIGERGSRRGLHHEIYLSDIRKADPAKWKTIIRQPLSEK